MNLWSWYMMTIDFFWWWGGGGWEWWGWGWWGWDDGDNGDTENPCHQTICVVEQRTIEWHNKRVQKLFQQTKWKLTLKHSEKNLMATTWNFYGIYKLMPFTEISCTVPFIPIWELLQTKRYHVAMKSQLPTMRCSVQEQHLFWISNQLLIDCFQRFSENPGQQRFKKRGCCSAESRGEGMKDFIDLVCMQTESGLGTWHSEQDIRYPHPAALVVENTQCNAYQLIIIHTVLWCPCRVVE